MSASSGELARRFFERFWNQRELAAFDELSESESTACLPDGTSMPAHRFRDEQYAEFLRAFPDLHLEIEDVLENGDKAVVRWFARGTHRGDGMGVKASGQEVGFRGMTWFQFRNGKVVHGWNCWDQGGLMHLLWRSAPVG